MRSRVELFENIRKDWRLDEPSIRELAERQRCIVGRCVKRSPTRSRHRVRHIPSGPAGDR